MAEVSREEFERLKDVNSENNTMIKEIRTAIVGDKKLGITGMAERLEENQREDLERHRKLDTRVKSLETFKDKHVNTYKFLISVGRAIVAVAAVIGSIWGVIAFLLK